MVIKSIHKPIEINEITACTLESGPLATIFLHAFWRKALSTQTLSNCAIFSSSYPLKSIEQALN